MYRTVLLTTAAALLCSACASTVGPTPQQMQALKSIDVVIAVPMRSFAFTPSDDGDSTLVAESVGTAAGSMFGSITTGAPSAATLGPAFAIGLAAGLINRGIEHVAAAPAREAAPIVAPTVDDVDLRRTVFSQLQALLTPERAATLRLSDAPMPPLLPGLTVEQSLTRAAGQGQADAMLYLFVAPYFRSPLSDDPHTLASAMLVTRDERILREMSMRFAGPKAIEGASSGKARWWADGGRYRRTLLLGTHAVLVPLADALNASEAYLKQTQHLREQKHRLHPSAADAELRTSTCALDSDAARVMLRQQQLWNSLLVLAICDDERGSVTKTPQAHPTDADVRYRVGPPLVQGPPLEDVWFTRVGTAASLPPVIRNAPGQRPPVTSR